MSGALTPFVMGTVGVAMNYQAARAQAQAIKQQSAAEAQMLRQNAYYYEAEAQMARQKAQWDEGILREQIRSTMSAQKAAYAARGVRMAGSPFEVISETLIQGQKDILAVRYGGELQAYKALATADMYRQKAAYVLSAGAATAGTLTRASLFSSALSMYNLWNVYGPPQRQPLGATSTAGARAAQPPLETGTAGTGSGIMSIPRMSQDPRIILY